MRKYLKHLLKWLKDLFKREEVVEEEIVEKEIPLEEAFRMWKEEQRKK